MTELTFNVHKSEQDKVVNEFYQGNKKRFNEQLSKVLRVLLRGQELTQVDAMQYYGVFSLSTRISELKRAGIEVSKGWTGETPKVRTYFLSKEEIERITKLKIV